MNRNPGLQFAGMLDILITILFFLLKNYSHVITNFNVSDDLQLPTSTAFNPPTDSILQLVVTQKAIFLDDVLILNFQNGQIPRSELYEGVTITKLYRALDAHRQRGIKQAALADKGQFRGAIVLQADKALEFKLLKKVIYTAGATDFGNLRLAVIKRDL